MALSLRKDVDASTPPLRKVACKFTVSYKKERKCNDLSVQTRRDHFERFVERAGVSFGALTSHDERPRAPLHGQRRGGLERQG